MFKQYHSIAILYAAQLYMYTRICIYMHNVVIYASSGRNLENNVMKMQYIRELHHIDVKDVPQRHLIKLRSRAWHFLT